MIIRIIVTILGLAALVGALVAAKGMQFKAMIAAGEAFVMPPETVTTFSAESDSWEQAISAVGSLEAVEGVMVAAESFGRVEQIAFEAGAWVKEGDLLLKMDTASEEADLQSAQATLELAKVRLERAKNLLAKQTISQSEFDSADAEFKNASARATAIQVLIDKKTVKAPFSGRLGIRLVNVGEFLQQGTPIVSLQALDQMYVNFLLPQQALSQIEVGFPVRVTSDFGDPVMGKVTVISPQVEASTRNIRMQATIANPGNKLLPGMFAHVEVILPEKNDVLMIPSTSVLHAPYSDSVFVVEAGEESGQVARQQFVRLGESRGDFVSVIEGLKPGEVVVSTGVFKLRNGINVVVNNELSPKFELAPTPEDI